MKGATHVNLNNGMLYHWEPSAHRLEMWVASQEIWISCFTESWPPEMLRNLVTDKLTAIPKQNYIRLYEVAGDMDLASLRERAGLMFKGITPPINWIGIASDDRFALFYYKGMRKTFDEHVIANVKLVYAYTIGDGAKQELIRRLQSGEYCTKAVTNQGHTLSRADTLWHLENIPKLQVVMMSDSCYVVINPITGFYVDVDCRKIFK